MIAIAEVTVLEDRAAITRRGAVTLAGGQQRVVIDRVSPVLADKTLTASCANARVLDVRCERYVAPWREGAPAAATTLREELTQLEARLAAARTRAQVARAESEALGSLLAAALHDLAITASRGATSPSAAAELAELDRRDAAARARRVDAELEAEDLAHALDRLTQRLRAAESEAGEHAARIVIDLIAETPGDGALEATYIVPGAAWRPFHRATLAREAGTLQLETTACVWQATGEDWTDVALHCSLERPSLGVEPPELSEDELRTRRKPESMIVEAREQEQQTVGQGASEVPGIDDGGLGTRLSAARVSVRADGTPHRVPVASLSAAAQVTLVAIPLKSPWVHVRARFVNPGPAPVLAGPVDLIMASGYVGRGELGFVAPGEKAYLGFGPDADLRVHRTETRERDEAGILGNWNVQTVRVAVRLSNLGTHKREVTVTERIPISEVEQVEVHASAADAYMLDEGDEITQVTARAFDERGLVTWAVELAPHGRRAVTLEYKIKSQRGVAGV
jgi:uncharacterized protein (TIGR02231 family)